MTDLDRRVAELGGKPPSIVNGLYSPSTNLIHAFALWNEARPEGWSLEVYQHPGSDDWQVRAWKRDKFKDVSVDDFPDLPRAITEAWVEAMEATCQK